MPVDKNNRNYRIEIISSFDSNFNHQIIKKEIIYDDKEPKDLLDWAIANPKEALNAIEDDYGLSDLFNNATDATDLTVDTNINEEIAETYSSLKEKEEQAERLKKELAKVTKECFSLLKAIEAKNKEKKQLKEQLDAPIATPIVPKPSRRMSLE